MVKRSAETAARTREAIIAAARAAFTERGYAGASTADIARRAGVSEGALFHHFPAKLGLFEAVFVEVEGELNAYAKALSRDGPPLEGFLAGCRATMEFGQRPDFQRIVLVEAPSLLGGSDWRRIDASKAITTVVRGLRHLAGPENLSQDAARQLAVLVLGAINESIFALARGEEGIDIDSSLAMLGQMLSPWVREPAQA